MTDSILFAGCILVLVAFGVVVVRCGTAIFSLTALNVFLVASATLPVFFFGFLLNEVPDSVTPEHTDVVTYSILGLFAMVAGIYVGWLPLMQSGHLSHRNLQSTLIPAHINQRVGMLTFLVGMVGELLFPRVYDVPTLSTAINCLASLARFGLLILLLSAMHTRRWRWFLIAIGIFGFVSILSSFATGHTFLRINALVPLLVVFVASSGFALRYILPWLLAAPMLVPAVGAWMDTRQVIRSGSLTGLPLFEQVSTFFREYLSNFGVPTAQSFMELLQERVDMTQILAEQVRNQPDFEPYAYGETIYSAFYTLIPRFLWSEKPEVAGGSEFVARFTGMIRPSGDTTSIGVAYPFELYANGGPILVIVGLGLLGYVCAKMELALLQTPKSLGSFWALGLATVVLCDGGQRTDVVLPALVASALAAYLLGKQIENTAMGRGILSSPDADMAQGLGANRTHFDFAASPSAHDLDKRR